MANAPLSGPAEPASESGPSSAVERGALRCPGCGRGVDPLRAGHVAVLEGQFSYFCEAECKATYLSAQGGQLDEPVRTLAPPAGVVESHPAEDAAGRGEQAADDAPGAAGASIPGAQGRRATSSALDAVGIASGALVPAIGLLGPAASVARLPLALASLASLLARAVLFARDSADPHPLVVLAPVVGAAAAACYALAVADPHAPSLLVFAALSSAAAIAVEAMTARARARVAAERERIERALDVRVRVLHADGPVELPASEVRAGEQVVAEAGEVVGVDAMVTAGEARVVPWPGAPMQVVRREGDSILAGARLVTSRLRMTTTWSGRDRAWVKLLSPAGRIDVASPTPRTLRHVVERGAPLAGIALGAAALGANASPVEVVAAACAGVLAFGGKASCSGAALHYARAHIEALASGVVYRDASSFERAACAATAVLCARGTVLMGEPEVVAVDPVGPFDVDRVLSLAAGAEAISAHPFAAAVLRATRTRGIRPDAVRNGSICAGLGVTAVASTGERLVVGGRAIMLKEKIGVAAADARMSQLEAEGRSVLLVALGDRLIGSIALQDGLRPGARAAVQRLLDAHVEPVLLSGEARETCETIGRALDIEHVRPEVLPADRGAEVRALAEGGNVVAVVGHPAGDDGALGAADVAVAMNAAGATPGEWAVALASDDVRDAAGALAIPHAARDRARIAAALGGAPCLVALLAIGFGVAPLAVAPLALVVGAVAVAAHAREALSRR